MAQIEVRGLGANEIRIGRRRITPATEVVFALAFYLCVRAGERVTRDDVVEVFWGTGDVTKGRHSLRQMLYKLRQRGFALDEDGEELYLDPSRLTSDVFDALQDSWSDDASVASLEASLELIPALTKGVSSRFHEWLDSLRARLGAQHRRAAIRHLHQARREGRWADLDRIALLMLRTDPLNEEATLARAESAAMIGSKALALEILDQYVEELGDKATRIALPATVLRRRISERGGTWRGESFRETQLVGRASEMRTLSHLLSDASRRHTRSVLLVGAAGNGKTRLMNEFRTFAEMDGIQCIHVRADASANRRPLSFLLSASERIRDLRGSAGASPDAMAIVNRILELSDRTHLAAAALSEALSGDAVAWALSCLLSAAAAEQRTLIFLDDLHNCDHNSSELLARVAALTSDFRVSWILSSRLAGSTGLEKITSCWRDAAIVEVKPLPSEKSIELAELMLGGTTAIRSSLATDLARQSGGNPLFLRELASHAKDRHSNETLPLTLRSLMRLRLENLAANESTLLRVVLLLGGHASLDRVSRVLKTAPVTLAEPIERLEAEGILSLGTQSRLELHECWQVAVSGTMRPATTAALALQCAECLVGDVETSNNVDLLRAAADLLLAAGEHSRACLLLTSVATALGGSGLRDPALSAIDHALSIAPDTASRSNALAARAMILFASGDLERAAIDCEEALRGQFVNGDERRTRTLVLSIWVESLWRVGQPYQHALSMLATAVADPLLDQSTRQFACSFGMRTVLIGAHSPLETHFYTISQEETERSGPSVWGELCRLVHHSERGEPSEVLKAEATLASLPTEDLPVHLRSLLLRNRAMALRYIGSDSRAVELLEETYHFALSSGRPSDAKRACLSGAFHALDQNRVERALEWLARADTLASFDNSSDSQASHLHARARACVQLERYEECLAVYEGGIASVLADRMKKRRAVVSSCLVYALTALGRHEEADEALNMVIETIEAEPPSMQMDLPAELAFRTLSLMRRTEDAGRLMASYVSRRRSAFDRAILPCFPELRSATQSSHAEANSAA